MKYSILFFMLLFFAHLQGQENNKILLQTNKNNYVSGDTIFFTAIIAQDNEVIRNSKKLKLEVLGENDKVLLTDYFSINNGISKGYIYLQPKMNAIIYAINAQVMRDRVHEYLSNEDSLTLETVMVTNKMKRTIKQINDTYSTGMFNNLSMARVLDLINEPPNYMGTGISILEYIQGKIPGLMVSVSAGGRVVLKSIRRISIDASSPILIYLDEQEAGDFINQIYPRDVALIKYWPPGTAQIPGNGGAGVLAIYTKKWSDLK